MTQANDNLDFSILPDGLSVSLVSHLRNVTRQSIFLAIHSGRLKAFKANHRWVIKKEDLKEFIDNKFSRKDIQWDGEPVFDPEKGRLGVKDAARRFGLDRNHIYYSIRCKRLPAERKGWHYVIHLDEAIKWYRTYFS